MFCPNCGAETPHDSIFCENCGCRIAEDSARPQGSARDIVAPPGQPVPRRPGQPANESARRRSSCSGPEPVRSTRSGGVKYAAFGLAAVLLIGAGILLLGKGGKDGNEAKLPQAAAESATLAPTSGESPVSESGTVPASGAETAGASVLTPEGMAAVAGRLSTAEHARPLDFEWALDYVLYGGETAVRVLSDPSQTVRITGDLYPLLNGGWKAFLFTAAGEYGSDVERYCHAEINTSGSDFTFRLNWKYLFEPTDGSSVEESGSSDYEGSFDAGTGMASVLADDSRIEFEAFYTSPELDAQYALGTFTWISGEKDRIALMRRKPGAGDGISIGSSGAHASSGDGAGQTPGGVPQTVTLDDFDWYYADGFPADGTPLRELQDLGGPWKSLISVVTTVDGTDRCRLMLSDAEIQYMGYKVTVLMHMKGSYEYPIYDPGSVEALETADGPISAFGGDWNEDSGMIDVFSESSAMALQLRAFVDSGGVQYAIGSVYRDDREIGEIVMVREIQQ